MADLSKLSLSELEHDIWFQYGRGIKVLDRGYNEFNMISKYRFLHSDFLSDNKYPKEFTASIPEILYRNYYWVNSPYRNHILYDEIKNEVKKYKKNKDIIIKVKTQDERVVPFIPDYVNDDGTEFLHYFDMSYFLSKQNGVLVPRNYFTQILSYFEKSKSKTLTYYVDECYNTLDYN